ncbi:MAG TPA: CehA/McbA family metallohydrolase [Ignavibacteriaceae bacterium]|nr:CehA/McbA family metallohydrolase [Ignavibacteriaceae bacterium]
MKSICLKRKINFWVLINKCVIRIIIGVCLFANYVVRAQNIYFGDLHVHSELSFDCSVPIDTVYYQAQYVANLDFVCVTDHDRFSTDSIWAIAMQKANEFYAPGVFVTFLGWEYTHGDGHKIAYYDKNNGRRFVLEHSNQKQFLDSVFANGGLVHIPHPDGQWGPSDLSQYHPGVVKNIEVTGWGGYRHEYFGNPNADPYQQPGRSVQSWLNHGKLFGLMGVSDAHNAYPVGSKGLTAVIADSLNRKSIFEAIRKRHVYATTNGQKIKLRFNSGNNIMGDSIYHRLYMPKQFEFSCTGTANIERIEVIKNNQVWRTYFPNNTEYNAQFEDRDSIYYTYYYLRITQIDGNMAWSSPIFFFQSSDSILPVFDVTWSNNYLLSQNYPNPFNFTTTINYEICCEGFVVIKLYDILGREIVTLVNERKTKGLYKIPFNANGLESGIYFYIFSLKNDLGGFSEQKKMVLLK